MSRKENLDFLPLGRQDRHMIDKNWIPGHPDRTVPNRDLWIKHMWGNHMVDAAAAKE